MHTSDYLEQYYQDYYLQILFFVHQSESQWLFEKNFMSRRLTTRNETDKLVLNK